MNKKDRKERAKQRRGQQAQNRAANKGLLPRNAATTTHAEKTENRTVAAIDRGKLWERIGSIVLAVVTFCIGQTLAPIPAGITGSVAVIFGLIAVLHIIYPKPSNRAWLGCLAVMLVCLSAIGLLTLRSVANQNAEKEKYKDADPAVALKPANEPMPELAKRAPELPPGVKLPPGMDLPDFGLDLKQFFKTNSEAVAFFAGEAVALLDGAGRFLIVESGEKPLLWIERDKFGAYVCGEIWGPNREVIALIERNKIVATNNVLRIKKDRSSLAIFDKRNNEVVRIRFLNPRAFSIRANLWMPDGAKIRITDDKGIIMPNGFALTGTMKDTGCMVHWDERL